MTFHLRSYILAMTAAVLLTGCSAKCNCPQCPDRATVVTPDSGSTTVITPRY